MKNSNLENLTDLHVNYENDETLGWKDKIKSFIFGAAIFVLAVFITCILLLLALRDRSHNEKVVFANKEDIQTEITSCSQIARIHINGTYKKNDVKYYIFTTDISGDREFTLSEYEYDKYIGLDNNAVDCTVYTVSCYSDVYSLKNPPFDFIKNSTDLQNMLNNIVNVSCDTSYKVDNGKDVFHDFVFGSVKEYKAHINYADGMYFKNFIITVKRSINSSNRTDISCQTMVSRYSFMGENEFSKEEINQYIETMENLNTEIVKYCREDCPQYYLF